MEHSFSLTLPALHLPLVSYYLRPIYDENYIRNNAYMLLQNLKLLQYQPK